MAAVDQINFSAMTEESGSDTQAVKSAISRMFWLWYHTHQDIHVTTVAFWIFKKNVCVSDLHGIFTLLFGPDSDPSQSA